ncbi:LytR/AlgR family response regulator transcription factor [Runella sp.]|uniref:LytR/AlgR family response regulator transcription factor n=1 Tax=Runella sp. TaxID=1960881 RepID=UPI003D0AC3EF
MKISCIALDDEPASLAVIEQYAELVPFLALKRTFVSVKEALTFLKTERVDCVFLDIKMPDLLGTELARILKGQTQIIFITAYSEYALQGFEVQALDYLLKPIEFDRFLQTANRVHAHLSQRVEGQSSIFVKEGYDWVRIQLNEVQYIQSDTNLLFIYERNRRIITRMTMTEMLSLLPPERFLRVHKSYIVAVESIQKIERHQLTLDKGVVPIGELYREKVGQLLLR